jgi:hypothetical protein
VENERGECLSIYADVDRMESELLKRAPQDATDIRHFAGLIRRLAKLRMLDSEEPILTLLRSVPALPLLRQLSRISAHDYGNCFTHPLLKSLFGEGQMAALSASALVFSLAWMSGRNAGYAIGGSQNDYSAHYRETSEPGRPAAIGRQGGQNLSGEQCGSWCSTRRRGNDRSRLGDLHRGRSPLSTNCWAASTKTKSSTKRSARRNLFRRFSKVSFGIGRDHSDQPQFVTCVLDAPFVVDPDRAFSGVIPLLPFRPNVRTIGQDRGDRFSFDLQFEYWLNPQQRDPAQYQAEKQRVAEQVPPSRKPHVWYSTVARSDRCVDAGHDRYAGNWQGSMEGWLLTPASGFGPLRRTLPDLRRS